MSARKERANILVLGATGNTGAATARALTRRGVHFRAAVRNPAKGEAIKSDFAELVEVDYGKPETLTAALVGVEKLFLVQPGTAPNSVDEAKHIVDAAAAAGVRHIVKLSAVGLQHPTRAILAADHLQIETYIRSKGIALTSLRPSGFHTNLFMMAHTIKTQNTVYSVVHSSRMNWISVDDIGEAAAVALSTAGHEGNEYYLTGPDTITTTELAAKLTKALGREIRFVPIDDAALRQTLSGFGMHATVVDKLSNLYQYFADGGYDIHTPDLKMLTGSTGKTLDEFLNAIKGALAPQ